MITFRAAIVALISAGVSMSVAPAHAKPEPIRAFTVSATDTGLRASALVPGRPGRSATLQQFVGGKWVSVASTRTKRAQGKTPRARWRVPFDDLRSSSSIHAGPLAELLRLRAKSGNSTSKPKRVRISRPPGNPLTPTVPGFVGGDIKSQVSADGSVSFAMSGFASWEFAGIDPADADWATYKLLDARLTWVASGTDPSGCIYSGGGPSTVLGGDGRVQVPPSTGGAAFYNFRVRVAPTLKGIRVQCPGDPAPSVFDGTFDLTFITTDCPSAGRPQAVYQSPPWTDQNFRWGFSGKVGLGKAGFCTNVVEAPGLYYEWSLNGIDPQPADDLAPLPSR